MVESVVVLAAIVIFLTVFVEHNGGCLKVLGGLFVMMLWIMVCGGLFIIKETRETAYPDQTQEKVIRDTGIFIDGC